VFLTPSIEQEENNKKNASDASKGFVLAGRAARQPEKKGKRGCARCLHTSSVYAKFRLRAARRRTLRLSHGGYLLLELMGELARSAAHGKGGKSASWRSIVASAIEWTPGRKKKKKNNQRGALSSPLR